MSVSEEDRSRIATAIRAAEAKTSGEIICVLAQTSTDATALPVLLAALVALALPWLLVVLTKMSVHHILVLQVAVFFLLVLVLCLPRVRVALLPRAARRYVAHRAAMEQFTIRGIARKKDRTGILIFVSLAEHYARIIADEGIAHKVSGLEWQAAIDALTAHMRDGHIATGFIAAIERCGAVLAAHAPPDDSAEELPDRLYVV